MQRIQKIRVLLNGDTPNAVRKLGECKQTVHEKTKHWWLTVPNNDTGWAALQIAMTHMVVADGGRRLVAVEAIGIRAADIPEIVVHDGVIGFEHALNGDVIVGNLATARSEFDARADRVEPRVPVEAFATGTVAELRVLWDQANNAEDAASDAIRLLTRQRDSWSHLRQALAERIRDLERTPELPFAQGASEPAQSTSGGDGSTGSE